MFKSFLGFNLVKEYHSTRADNRFHPSKRNQIIIKSAIVLLATLLVGWPSLKSVSAHKMVHKMVHS